jgi:hypothetical protein
MPREKKESRVQNISGRSGEKKNNKPNQPPDLSSPTMETKWFFITFIYRIYSPQANSRSIHQGCQTHYCFLSLSSNKLIPLHLIAIVADN